MEITTVIVVSGLPRSGTSLMMQMLAAAGIPTLTDDRRVADTDNPKGYFELEKVKKLEAENHFLLRAGGKAVKIISHLLPFLPKEMNYKIIFLERNSEAIIQSQNKMLQNTQKQRGNISDLKLMEIYGKHLSEIRYWLGQQKNLSCITIKYEHIIKRPFESALQIQSFLGIPLDTDAMARQVDSSLNHFRTL